ncbi:MAG: MutS-related protein, partial [Bacillota bacterium]
SVIDGISYFYAEVKRLKLLLDELKGKSNLPLLFLIDEIFKGTNNIERLIGSRSFIKSIAGKNGLGCVTTHDLELVKLADEINEIRNFHFREEVHTGKMHFDYVLREGPCPTTNALRIMELEGLPVEKINQENGKNVN